MNCNVPDPVTTVSVVPEMLVEVTPVPTRSSRSPPVNPVRLRETGASRPNVAPAPPVKVIDWLLGVAPIYSAAPASMVITPVPVTPPASASVPAAASIVPVLDIAMRLSMVLGAGARAAQRAAIGETVGSVLRPERNSHPGRTG